VPTDAPVDWAGLAVEHGFCDQSHLVHDFSSITGITPSAYRPRSANAHNHLPV
jgi:AraC-like DNA-binding protein